VRSVDALGSELREDDMLFVSYSIYDPDLPRYIALPHRKACYFHGVTPHVLLASHDPVTADLCRESEAQFPSLDAFEVLFANSAYTAEQLQSYFARHRHIRVAPPVARAGVERMLNLPLRSEVPTAGAELLYVGRVAPHKRVEDLVRLCHAYRAYDATATLSLVGTADNASYKAMLTGVIAALALPHDAVRFLGSVSETALIESYGGAAAYLSMSEHEGFCVPVLEAMAAGVPVVAYAQPAVSELMGASGMKFLTKDFDAIAAALRRMVTAPGAWASAAARSRTRAQEVVQEGAADAIVSALFPDAPGISRTLPLL
jgi:glycosyltransferase involved in cell wall biosynthesis